MSGDLCPVCVCRQRAAQARAVSHIVTELAGWLFSPHLDLDEVSRAELVRGTEPCAGAALAEIFFFLGPVGCVSRGCCVGRSA